MAKGFIICKGILAACIGVWLALPALAEDPNTHPARLELSNLPNVAALYGQLPLPDDRFGCERDGAPGLCARPNGWSVPAPELFVGIDGRTNVLEDAGRHRHLSKELAVWMPDPKRYPPGADRSGEIRDAWLAHGQECDVLFVNRLRRFESRPLGWLRTFIDLMNNTGRDYFFGIDAWTPGQSRSFDLPEGESQRLETVIPVTGGAWAVVARERRMHRGGTFSASDWQAGGLFAVFFPCN